MIILMVIGKTSSSISKTEIFTKFSETQILKAVFPEISEIPCLICSPLRVDNKPSFSIYMTDGGHVAWKDHAMPNERGGLMDLLCKYWKCTFNQALDKICDLPELKDEIVLKSKQIKTLTRKEASTLKKIEVKVRPWRDYDYEYWASYGIEKQWLKWAEVYPISYKIITKKDKETGEIKKYCFPTEKYSYAFVERKQGILSIKIYQPFSKKFKWCSSMSDGVISLWTKVPEYGDRIVICSSLKDALCLSCQAHIPAIAPQGEGYSISETACNELRRRYKKVFICFDTDKAGKEDAEKLAKETGFINIVPDLGTEKDLSDFFKSLENKEEFKKIELLFH
jgi:hypothetical protein